LLRIGDAFSKTQAAYEKSKQIGPEPFIRFVMGKSFRSRRFGAANIAIMVWLATSLL
jgi:hypothetical protein